MSNYFKKTPDEMVFDLIDRDNPNLQPRLTAQNCYITSPEVNTGPDAGIYNTIATVRPRFGSGLAGPVQIKYNRIDLAVMFKDMSPVVVSGFSQNEQYATRDELPGIIASCYGLPIAKGEADPETTLNHYVEGHAEHGNGIFKIAASNKCFIGQILVAYRRDKLESVSSLLDPPVLTGLPTEPYTKRGLADPQLPAPWAYFGDIDFTEIYPEINHLGSLTAANIAAIGAFAKMPLQYADTGVFDPACPYKSFSHFGSKHPGVSIPENSKPEGVNKTSSLKGAFPWINTNYTHVKLVEGMYDPVSGALIPTDRRPTFALYYNLYIPPTK